MHDALCDVLIHCLVNPVYVYSLVFWGFFCELYNIYIKILPTCICITSTYLYNDKVVYIQFYFIDKQISFYFGCTCRLLWENMMKKKKIIIEIVYLAISLKGPRHDFR